MKQSLLLLLSMATIVLSAYSQDNPGTQNISLGACGSCNSYSGNVNTASPSAIPACAGIANDDLFYTFVAPAPTIPGDLVGIKVTVTTSEFNAVIQLINNSNVSIKCVNDVAGIGGEELIHYGLTTGQTYHIRVHSFDDVPGAGNFNVCFEQIPELFLRPQFLNFGPSGDGYSVNENISREYFINPGVVQKTGWKLVCVETGEELYRETNGITSQVNLNTITGVCYNKSYMVYVRVMIGGIWCGYGPGSLIIMEPAPSTFILPATCGQTYDIYQSVLNASFLVLGQTYEWRFTTDNGNTQFTALSPAGSSIIELVNIPQMRYNKIYTVEIRANVCGIWGPWVGGCFIITGPLPYTELEGPYCNQNYGIGGNLICEFVANATQYVWQFAPIECGDSEFVPIGPAQLVYSPDPIVNLGEIVAVPGTCYRVGVKPFVGEQQGDYGNFCQIQINGGFGGGNGPEEGQDRSTAYFSDFDESYIYPNPGNGEFSLWLSSGLADSGANLEIRNVNGKLVYSDALVNQSNQFSLSLSQGVYFVSIMNTNESKVFKYIVK